MKRDQKQLVQRSDRMPDPWWLEPMHFAGGESCRGPQPFEPVITENTLATFKPLPSSRTV